MYVLIELKYVFFFPWMYHVRVYAQSYVMKEKDIAYLVLNLPYVVLR